MNEIHNQKKRTAIKWVIVLTAIALLSVIVAFAVLQSVPVKVVGGELAAADSDGVIIGVTEERGIKLLSETISPAAYSANGISAQAESAKTLTATVEPSNAQNVEVDWSVSWVNAESEWATGKTVTDYVTVTPVSDGALTANLACLKAFGEQVKITCTYRLNTSVKAECTVDYSKKFLSQLLTAKDTWTEIAFGDKSITSYRFTSVGNFFVSAKQFQSSPQYSDFTVNDSFVAKYTVTINPTFLNYLTAVGVTIAEPEKSFEHEKGVTGGAPIFHHYCQGGTPFFYLMSAGEDYSFCNLSAEDANKAVGVALQHTDIPIYTISLKAVGTYSTFEHSMSIYFSEGSLPYVVTDVSLNDSNIIV